MSNQKLFLESNSDTIKETELKYNYLPKTSLLNYSHNLSRICLRKTKEIALMKTAGNQTINLEINFRKYRDFAVKSLNN